jgi:hypothetical protein
MKLEKTKEIIRESLSRAGGAGVVLWSGGMDSTLVLSLAREVDPDIDVLLFKQDFSAEQWEQAAAIIRDWDLQVFSYAPANRYFLPNERGVSLVDEYGVADFVLPQVRDFIAGGATGGGCALELSPERMLYYDGEWQVFFTGVLQTDSLYATNGNPFQNEAVKAVNGKHFVSPLFDWTKEEVFAAVRELNIPYSKEFYENGDERFDTGNINACAACLCSDKEVYCPREQKLIPPVVWDKEGMLEAFRQKFGY